MIADCVLEVHVCRETIPPEVELYKNGSKGTVSFIGSCKPSKKTHTLKYEHFKPYVHGPSSIMCTIIFTYESQCRFFMVPGGLIIEGVLQIFYFQLLVCRLYL